MPLVPAPKRVPAAAALEHEWRPTPSLGQPQPCASTLGKANLLKSVLLEGRNTGAPRISRAQIFCRATH